MYHDIFQKENNYNILETIDIKVTSATFYMHAYLVITLFMLFNFTWKYICWESNGTKIL